MKILRHDRRKETMPVVKKTLQKKDGSALLIAIVIMMVVTMLSLLLLLASYSFFATALKQQENDQCRELAETLSAEIEQELTTPRFANFQAVETAMQNGTDPLWCYLRINLWQQEQDHQVMVSREHIWNPYIAGDDFQNKDESTRVFTVPELSEQDVADETTVSIYWTKPSGTKRYDDNQNSNTDTIVYVTVTCTKGKQTSDVTKSYNLTMEKTENYALRGTDEEGNPIYYPDSVMISSSVLNPDNFPIDPRESWIFTTANDTGNTN
ncbi:MAG: hypothetical protein PUC32_07925 [Oscillospiraceae bacterium]|nr:hypothetical protein [Oscillospiraceae bacterium]